MTKSTLSHPIDDDVKKLEFRQMLQKRFASEVRELSKVNQFNSLSAIGIDWLCILSAFIFSAWVPHVWAWAISAVVIASRQHALLIIMHDAAHYRVLSSKKWNDRISNWFLAYPMLVSTEKYRENHLKHHSHTNTDDDPDWTRKQGDSRWEFPKSRREIGWLIASDLIGGGFLTSFNTIYNLGGRKQPCSTMDRTGINDRLIYYFIAIVGLILTGWWPYLIGLWFLPAFTLLPAILRIRSIAEHFGLSNQHDLNASRNYHCNTIERILIAPHNVGYHLDHHLFPSVPFHQLPELHERLKTDNDYNEHSHQSIGLFGARCGTVESDIRAESQIA